MLQIGGFRAQRSHVTAVAWATFPPTQPPASDTAPQHNPQPTRHTGPQTQGTQSQLQQQPASQLMLVTGSSAGCLRLPGQSVEAPVTAQLGKGGAVHGQSVEAPATAQMGKAGAMLRSDLMQLHRTLHDVDLLGVTCVSVKPTAAISTGQCCNECFDQVNDLHLGCLFWMMICSKHDLTVVCKPHAGLSFVLPSLCDSLPTEMSCSLQWRPLSI